MKLGSRLQEKLVGVIGFNARPIAVSAKKLGAKVYVSDYWGDADLVKSCENWVSVLRPKRGERQRRKLRKSSQESLVNNFIEVFSKIEFDLIIIGGGFDDHSEILQPIADSWTISGNSISKMKRSRDKRRLSQLASESEIRMPFSQQVNSSRSAIKAANKLGYPCIIRSGKSGGGGLIRFALSPSEVKIIYKNLKNRNIESLIVQQYISGIDLSSNIISTGEKNFTVSIQGQLIGMPSAGRNCDFVYCGNYYPTGVSQEVKDKISQVSEIICRDFDLIGLNGIDFILDGNNDIWILEVNPRIPGSLEMVEKASNESILAMHIEAEQGIFHRKKIQMNPAVKLILYSRKTGEIGNLSKFKSTVDRTPEGVFVRKGDPVCTIIQIGTSLHECYTEVFDTAKRITSDIRVRHLPIE